MLKMVRFKNNIINSFLGGFQACLYLSGDFSLHIAQSGSCFESEAVLYNANYGYAVVANQSDLGSSPSFPNMSQMCTYIILPHPEGSKSSLHALFPGCSLSESGTGREKVTSAGTLIAHCSRKQSCCYETHPIPFMKFCSICLKRPINTDHSMREYCNISGLFIVRDLLFVPTFMSNSVLNFVFLLAPHSLFPSPPSHPHPPHHCTHKALKEKCRVPRLNCSYSPMGEYWFEWDTVITPLPSVGLSCVAWLRLSWVSSMPLCMGNIQHR